MQTFQKIEFTSAMKQLFLLKTVRIHEKKMKRTELNHSLVVYDYDAT